jgi:hypothetical protein
MKARTLLSLIALISACLLAAPSHAGSLNVTNGAARTGSYGLEVNPGTTCTGMDDEVLTNQTVSGTQSFEACDTLTAQTNFVVGTNGDATLTAGSTVVLGNGFRVDSGGALTVSVENNLLPLAFVQDDSPSAETNYSVEFYINLDSLSLESGNEIDHFTAYGAGSAEEIKIQVRQGASTDVVLAVRQNGGSVTETSPLSLSAGWNKVAVSWTAAAAASATLVVNDGAPETLTGLDTAARRIDFVRWGVVDGTFVRNPGVLLQDDFVSRR